MKKFGILFLFCLSFSSTRSFAIQNILFTQTKFEIKPLGAKNSNPVGEIQILPSQNDSEVILRSELLSPAPITLHLRSKGTDRFDIFVKPVDLPEKLSFFQTNKEKQPPSVLIGEGSCGEKTCQLSLGLEKIIRVKGAALLNLELVPTGARSVHFVNAQVEFTGLEKKSAVFHLQEIGSTSPRRN